ncbi:TPA: S6 family peptidase, partial [Escherichia coli]
SAYGNTAILSNDIPFQTYRDFAENKGMFALSNKNIPIYDKNVNIKIFLQSLCLILVVFLH